MRPERQHQVSPSCSWQEVIQSLKTWPLLAFPSPRSQGIPSYVHAPSPFACLQDDNFVSFTSLRQQTYDVINMSPLGRVRESSSGGTNALFREEYQRTIQI